MDEFIDYIKLYVSLSGAAEKDIRNLALLENTDKNHIISEEGKTCKRLYFIAKGTVRTFYYLKGKDVTHWIYPDQAMVTSWNSYISQVPSREYTETTEPATLASLSYEQWQELYINHTELERFGRFILEEQIAILDDFYKGYYFLSAKEKYELLSNTYPGVLQRANLGHVASMLGISQETLSRVRGK